MSSYARINEGISISEDWAELARRSPRAAVVYAMTWPAANVYGVLPGRLASFRAKVCPLLGLTDRQMEEILSTLEEQGHLVRFEAEGRAWCWLPSWSRQNEVRWDNVGPPDTPLPDDWEMPPGLREVLESERDTPKLRRLRRYFEQPPFAGLWARAVPEQVQNGSEAEPEPSRACAPTPSPTPSPTPYTSINDVAPPDPPAGGASGGGGNGSVRRLNRQTPEPDPPVPPEARDDWDQTTHIITCEENEVRGTLAKVCPTMPVADRDAWVMDIVKSIRDPNNPLDRAGMIQALTESPPRVTQRTPKARNDHLEMLIKRHYARTQEAQARASPRHTRGPLPPSDFSRVKTNEYGEVIDDG